MSATSESIDALRRQMQRISPHGAEYDERMNHPIPVRPVVNRADFILTRCKNKVVLNIGATQPLQGMIEKSAKKAYGLDIDRNLSAACENFIYCDLDQIHQDWARLPDDVNLVVAGEVIEHVTNPGLVVRRLKEYGRPAIITVPNAFSQAGIAHVRSGVEHVNGDHVAWYSYNTLKVLLEKCGYDMQEWYWYGPQGPHPQFSEGLIAVI